MSHLQKTFIAKAKGVVAQARQPHRMTRGQIHRHARVVISSQVNGGKKGKRKKDEPHWFYCECPPDHLIFTLRK